MPARKVKPITEPRGNMAAVNERLLNVREAAEMLGVEVSTLYGWAYQRRIAVVKLGSALRFRLSTIQRLIEDSERPALSFDRQNNNLNDKTTQGPRE